MNRQADNSFLDGWTDRYKATQTDLQADGWAYRSAGRQQIFGHTNKTDECTPICVFYIDSTLKADSD